MTLNEHAIRANEVLRRKLYIYQVTLEYIAKRVDRPGWLDDQGTSVAQCALNAAKDPELLKRYTTQIKGIE